MSWSHLFIYMQITDNIPGCWDKQRKRERGRQRWIKRRTYTRTISLNSYSRIQTFRETEKETRIKRPTMSDSIARQTEWENEIRIKGRTYTRRATDTLTQTERNRERTQIKRSTYRITIRWQYSRTLILKEKQREKHRSRDSHIHVQCVII